MAPTAPKKRQSIRSKSLKASSKPVSTASRLPDSVGDGFSSSKKDKRLIKHSAFKARIEKKASTPKPLKRRRPNKKLVTTLNSLVDALPDVDALAQDATGEQGAKIKHKSLKSKPGALKKREKLERAERERFGKNLAVLTTSIGAQNMDVESASGNTGANKESGAEPASTTSNRWAALRGFISQTLEQKEEFRR